MAGLIIGSLLLLSAALKGQLLWLSSALDAQLVLVAYEVLLAAWLFSGVRPSACRVVMVATFAVFALVSFAKALAGDSSCGCFGAVTINPSIMLLVDVGCLGLMLARPLRPAKYAPIVACVIAIFALGYHPNSSATFVDPQGWVGKPLPISDQLVGDVSISSGRWRLLLYHHDCAACKHFLDNYASAGQIVIAELPPYGAHAPWPFPRLQLVEAENWFVKTPVEICLENGVVTQVAYPNVDS